MVPTSVQKADHLGIKPLGRNRNLEFVAKSFGTEETTSEFLLLYMYLGLQLVKPLPGK
jgi:hypothetical protein